MAFKFNPFTGNFDIVSSSVWKNLTGSVSASSNTTLDTIPLADFKHAEYILTYENLNTNEVSTLHLRVTNDDGTLEDTVKNKMGSKIDVDLSAVVNGSNFDLNLVNNETDNVAISAAKLTLN